MFSVTIKDVIFGKNESNHDNLVKVPVTVIISDENDNVPNFLEASIKKKFLPILEFCNSFFDKNM